MDNVKKLEWALLQLQKKHREQPYIEFDEKATSLPLLKKLDSLQHEVDSLRAENATLVKSQQKLEERSQAAKNQLETLIASKKLL